MDIKHKIMTKNRFLGHELLRFIKEYKQKDCLWNVKSKNYKKADKKKKCYLELANKFNLSVTEVKAKINNLRSNFNREYNKAKKSSNGEVYLPKLYWYDEMTFIKDDILPNPCVKSDTIFLESRTPSSRKNSINSLEKLDEDDTNNDLNEFDDEDDDDVYSLKESVKPLKKVYSQKPDEFDEFFKALAAQVKTLPKTDAYEMMLEFQTLVTKKKIENEIKKKKY